MASPHSSNKKRPSLSEDLLELRAPLKRPHIDYFFFLAAFFAFFFVAICETSN